jgi:beta-mannosidase
MADARRSSVLDLSGAWEFAELPPGGSFEPAAAASLEWRTADVPGTVAGALRACGALDEKSSRSLDEREFVYRRTFPHDTNARGATLVFDGLATLTDVWLNGARLAGTRNMFRQYAFDVASLLQAENALYLHFRALATEFERKRPRGRWVTRLVNHRNLRYVRTSLLGRIPGWSPACAPVGPWRGIRLESGGRVALSRFWLRPVLQGGDGVVSVEVRGRVADGDLPSSLELRIGDRRESLSVRGSEAGEFAATGELRVPGVQPWWPHDLGTPTRYPLSVALKFGGEAVHIRTVQIGFRSIERQGEAQGGFALRLNGREVFSRGACWTPSDAVALAGDPAELRRVLVLVRDAGMNMLRVSGTMVYESDAFYDACDELGILVWQDFMFARMDYPEQDPDFAEEVRIEAEQILGRLHCRPSLAVLCGNSEVEQQAAMVGLPPESGRSPLFSVLLADAARRWCPEVPYVCSSPSGGDLPFHASSGISHYFGVGAYLRPLEDARSSRLRFASECLAFSNVPEDEALSEVFGAALPSVHAAPYKQGVPRDAGAGWDFADVTDHYVEAIFRCDSRALRYSDTGRYLALARVASGEMMARAIGIWRAQDSGCKGALVWFLRDLLPGSGWGVLDRGGRPKPAYWFLKRAFAPRAIWMTDEGVNGLRIHVHNDGPEAFVGGIRLRLIRADGVEVGAARAELALEGNSGDSFGVDRLLGRFSDANYVYRFGPCAHAIVLAELLDRQGTVVACADHLPLGPAHDLRDDLALRAVCRPRGDGTHILRVESRELALYARINVEGFLPSDNYFHIAPGAAREIVLRAQAATAMPRGSVAALNSRSTAAIEDAAFRA